jgi:uncharacterized membrane protein
MRWWLRLVSKRAISIRATFKRRFFAGLLVLIPIIFTLLIIIWFYHFVDSLLGFLYDNVLGYHIPGLGFISAMVLIFIVGVISTNVFGRKVIESFEKIILRIPVFKSIYTAIKQLVDAFSPGSKGSSFKRFVIVEYPRPGVYVFGFLTKESITRAGKDGSESPLRAVYIPTNNLYLGEIALFKNEDVFYTDIPVDEGIKIILSGGIATPERISEAR